MFISKETILAWLRNKPKDEVVSKRVQPISENCLVYNFLHQNLFSVVGVAVGAYYTTSGDRIMLPTEVSDIIRAQDEFFLGKPKGASMSAGEAINLIEAILKSS